MHKCPGTLTRRKSEVGGSRRVMMMRSTELSGGRAEFCMRGVCVCVCARNKTVKDSFTRASAADRPELWLPEQFFIIIVQQTKGKRKKDCVQHLIYNTKGTSFAICSPRVCVLEAPDKQFVMSTRGAAALTGC